LRKYSTYKRRKTYSRSNLQYNASEEISIISGNW